MTAQLERPVDRREFRGHNRDIITDRSPEIILSGPAGTGKSIAALNKVMLVALKYPESRQLITRKTRESLTQSGLVTWEDKVLPPKLYQIVASTMERKNRSSYTFPNKSEVVVAGLDKPAKIMSTEYDIIYVQEAIELTLNDWETLSTRLRNGKVPYQQLIGDTNPDSPRHWIKSRENQELLKLLESRHENNPALYNRDGTLTKAGERYIGVLDRLTGVRKLRLRHGKWVQAEGVVYEGFDREVHIIDRFDIPLDWPRYWVIDFGFVHPFVWQAWAVGPDGTLYRYREVYMTHRLVQDHAKQIKRLAENEPQPVYVICDHDAEDRATFERHTGLPTIAAHKTVSDGIQAVAARLQVQGNSRARIFFMRDSLVERDQLLEEKKLPLCTEDEFDTYIWNVNAGRLKGEEPVKENDHGMDTTRYIVAQLDLVGSFELGLVDQDVRDYLQDLDGNGW
jgi:PBSX family phage terminase large subunit